MNILVCDDVQAVATGWQQELREVLEGGDTGDVSSLSSSELADAVQQLEARRRVARVADSAAPAWGAHRFDNVDILVIDYDLLDIASEGYLTGEGVAYLARCYSSCGIIVALNQYGAGNYFDLTLRGHPESYADLNIGDRQLSNPALWTDRRAEFRPWYWPNLPSLVAEQKQRVDTVSSNMQAPILQFLSFPDTVVAALTREALSFLAPGGDSPDATTFSAFVADSGQGFKRKDKAFNDQSPALIAASRISKWLERMVLPGQDLLVDLPHLISRCPSLLSGDPQDPRLTRLRLTEDSPVNRAAVENQKFAASSWLTRDAWFWPAIEAAEILPEIREPWTHGPLSLAFCEDSTSFRKRDEAREFLSALPTPFVRRLINDPPIDGVEYRPSVRLAM